MKKRTLVLVAVAMLILLSFGAGSSAASNVGNFGVCTSLPHGWDCGSTNGLSGSQTTISNGILNTTLNVPNVGSDNQNWSYAASHMGSFSFTNPPCQPSEYVPSNAKLVTTTFTVNSFDAGTSQNWQYHIYIDLYLFLPNGPLTARGVSYQCLESMSMVENINGSFSPMGTTDHLCACPNTFTWNLVTLPSVSVGRNYTLQANVSQQAIGDLKAWGFPTDTPYELAGVEVGVEGYQFAHLSVSWSNITILVPSLTSTSSSSITPITTESTTLTSVGSTQVSSSSSTSSHSSSSSSTSLSSSSSSAATSSSVSDPNSTASLIAWHPPPQSHPLISWQLLVAISIAGVIGVVIVAGQVLFARFDRGKQE